MKEKHLPGSINNRIRELRERDKMTQAELAAKLGIYRFLFDATEENHVLRKFLNETYHIENDFLFQLNPHEYNTIPSYIIQECDQSVMDLSGA